MPKCDECAREFATESALSQHMKDKHGVQAAKPSDSGAPRALKRPKSLRRRNRHPVAIALVAVAVAAGVGVYFVASPYFASPPFPGITGESWIHIHPYLVIDIEGTNITIPASVGILQGGTVLEPIHTHDASGILHIELSQSDAKSRNYTLGDFFTIWNYTARTMGGSESPTLNGKGLPVEFSSANILGLHANSTYQVLLFVDGHNCATSGYSLCPSSPSQWPSLNLEHLDYCSSTVVPPGTPPLSTPCYPTDATNPATGGSCAATTTDCTIGNPYWDGTSTYPYGTGHTIVIEYVKG